MRKLAEIKPDIGIVINDSYEGIDSLLGLFQPVWIWDDYGYPAYTNLMLDKLELLYCPASAEAISKLKDMSNLHHLLLTEVSGSEIFQKMASNRNINSLTVTDFENLEFLEKFPDLERLNIIGYDSQMDLGPLTKLKKLRVLHLNCETSGSDLSMLDGLTSIEWFKFPANITQDNFKLFIENHQKIEVVEISPDTLFDLSPLQNLKSLAGLMIKADTLDLQGLFEFDRLKYLSIPEYIYKDSIAFDELKANLPDTFIFSNEGLCLGTGWLLLFIPVLILILLLLAYPGKKLY